MLSIGIRAHFSEREHCLLHKFTHIFDMLLNGPASFCLHDFRNMPVSIGCDIFLFIYCHDGFLGHVDDYSSASIQPEPVLTACG